MLLNLSNHPSAQWGTSQMKAAIGKYGSVSDMDFPSLNPDEDEQFVANLALGYLRKIKEIAGNLPEDELFAVHIMGELTFCFVLVNLLIKNNIRCVASTTRRISYHTQSGEKISTFSFVRFREYPLYPDTQP